MDKAESDANLHISKNEADISIVERIVRKTGNRKLAAILALDLFLVGVDTVLLCQLLISIEIITNSIFWQTSVAASSTIYQLARNPAKQERLFQELQNIFPTQEAEINQNVLEQIPYLRACVKEALR